MLRFSTAKSKAIRIFKPYNPEVGNLHTRCRARATLANLRQDLQQQGYSKYTQWLYTDVFHRG
ncbi:hypothetical protein MNBD_BACTEROID01-1106 [hydrothermal vent metagenome]|uniref:Uncharacterized protein n=1 Tax=hydrothermal vent metagenome TaxID=652676 RepID=A0A3B0TJX0_9ZZZZ